LSSSVTICWYYNLKGSGEWFDTRLQKTLLGFPFRIYQRICRVQKHWSMYIYLLFFIYCRP
jgi:hypothetical protein